ncbi:MAG: carboxymuconolactone decarboxylase family protein [Firmicutes bacterium]|nr:carboxymuconolactone decarboxylase family protein [Bacillota bacterium]
MMRIIEICKEEVSFNEKQIISILTAAAIAAGMSAFAVSGGAYSTDTNELTEELNTMTDTEKEDCINENLDTNLRYLSNLTAVTANADYGLIADLVHEAYENGVTAVEIKEAVFQAAPYCGYTRAINALSAVDDALITLDLDIPTESRAGVTEDNRYDEGLAVQRQLFGSQIGAITDDMTAAAKLQTLYLSGICFGDFYTRAGLDLNTREFLTFCTIISNGGCSPQVNSHALANLGVGHNSAMLRAAVLANEKYNGEEKTLEALAIVNALDDSAVGGSTAGEAVPEAAGINGYTTDAQELTDMMWHYKTDDADGYIDASLDADTQEILAEAAQAVVNESTVPTSDDERIQTLIDIAVLAADGTRADEFPSAVEDAANASNSADSMLAAVLLCVPYNGFPRTLNTTSAINAAVIEN